MVDHPVATVALAAVVAGVINLVWVYTHRAPGGLDVDETVYLTHAFRWHRMLDPTRPWLVFDDLFKRDDGPVLPLISALLLVPGPNSIVTAFVASVFAHGVTAVAVAGIGARTGGPRVGILSGLVVLVLPAAVISARSYQLAPAVAASLALAVWALLSSDNGARRGPMVLFGLSVGALLLSRSMAVVYLPGVIVAGAMHIIWTRRSLANLVLAAMVTLVTAGPWWWFRGRSIMGYLLSYGYGDRAGDFGAVDPFHRVRLRSLSVLNAVGLPLLVLSVVTVVGFVIVRRRSGGVLGIDLRRRTGLQVIVVTTTIGMIGLLSTANLGMYFDLPVITLAVPGLVAVGARVFVGRGLATVVVLSCATIVVLFVLACVDSGGYDAASRWNKARAAVFVGLNYFQNATVHAEPRLGSTDVATRMTAMDEWWASTRTVMDRIQDTGADGPRTLFVCASGPQMNGGTLGLEAELERRMRDMGIWWLNGSMPENEIESTLAEHLRTGESVIVVVDSATGPFSGEYTADACRDMAMATGWSESAAVILPDGGTAEVWATPR